MNRFLTGFCAGLVAGIVLGVLLSAGGIFFWARAIKNQEARGGKLAEKIEQAAANLAGKYPSTAQIEELAKIYLSDKNNFGLVIGISSNQQT